MHGLGNDFLVFDLISQNFTLSSALIKKLSDRNFGIGFDQCLTVQPPTSPDCDFRYAIYNADGSEAAQCGNGARCLLRFVIDEGLTTKSTIILETRDGKLSCKLEKDGNVTVDMGPPIFLPKQIPFLAGSEQSIYELYIGAKQFERVNVSALSLGNPHAVLIVPSAAEAAVQEVGQLVEGHTRFPDGVNVGFMQIKSRKEIELRVFERGVGETMACGSGACAAVVAGKMQGLLDSIVNVDLPGGRLNIVWEGEGNTVKMTGPTCRVFEGTLTV
mgnify:FL=1